METLHHPVYIRINRDGTPDASGQYILFGAYPKSRVEDEGLAAALTAIAGALPTDEASHAWISYKYYIFDDNEKDFMWYRDILHEGVRYRGVYFTDYRPSDTMNTSEENRQAGNGYHPGTVYWFRYEPICWRLLDIQEGKAWLLADVCIDSQPYRNVVWENSYVKSSIRAWLNSDFLNTAFSDRERDAVCLTLITNEMEDEDVCDGDRPGSDTLDLIHLLSLDEAAEQLPKSERQSTATDYALCQGISVNPKNGNSVWWLRTPYYSIEPWAHLVGSYSFFDFNSGEIGSTDTGIRPALWLKL